MALSQDMRERIFAAADALFAADESGDFPNVEAVRQESRAGMNYVVEAMKEWRQNQRRQVMTVRDPLPAELHGVIQEAGQRFWESARQMANESLDAARTAFESEKNDLVQLSAEQSAAFEHQATELAITLERVAELERQAAEATENEREMSRALEETRQAHQRAEQAAALAGVQAAENARRADELRAELTAARGETATAQATLSDVRAQADAAEREHAGQVERAGEETRRHGEALAELEAERGQAQQDAAAAREEAARLRGELAATQKQNAELLAALRSPRE